MSLYTCGANSTNVIATRRQFLYIFITYIGLRSHLKSQFVIKLGNREAIYCRNYYCTYFNNMQGQI